MTKMKLKVVIVATLLLLGAAFASTRLKRTSTQVASPSARNVQKPEVPTPIQEGVMTENQARHGRLFGEYRQDVTRGKRLRELVLEKGDVQVGRGIGNAILPRSFDLQQYLATLSCQANAIIVGTVREKSSNLIEDGSFTFTEYQVVVEDVLKENAIAPIPLNAQMTIVRAGGAVRLLNHVVRAIDYSQKPLVVGERHLLFLKFIPSTGAYRSFGDARTDDTFRLEGDQISQVSEQVLPLGPNRQADTSAFLKDVRIASVKICVR